MQQPATTAPARLSVEQVAGMLDERLDEHDRVDEAFLRGCERAVELGLAAVICRPTMVAAAAAAVRGSRVAVATAIGFDHPGRRSTLGEVVAEARCLLDDGARELALIATPARLDRTSSTGFFEEVAAVSTLAASEGATVRVMLEAHDLVRDDLAWACRHSVEAGAGMVQGGVWYDHDRASLSQIGVMRRALPPHVGLKWTTPMRSLDRLLLARGEGVDRFNGDAESLVAEAQARLAWGEIRVPVAGVDY